MKVDICLPVYNEEVILQDNVLRLQEFCFKQLSGYDWQIIILVNGSSDNSWSMAQALAEQYEKISAYHYKTAGKGLTIKNYAKQSEADIILYMDIDLAVKLEAVPRLLSYVPEYSIVLGSRLLPQSVVSRSWLRSLSSIGYNYIARSLLGHQTRDLQCGFKIVKRSVFSDLDLYLEDNNWFFDTELVVGAEYKQLKIKELPVDWSENRYQTRQSKVSLVGDAYKFMKKLFYLKKKLK